MIIRLRAKEVITMSFCDSKKEKRLCVFPSFGWNEPKLKELFLEGYSYKTAEMKEMEILIVVVHKELFTKHRDGFISHLSYAIKNGIPIVPVYIERGCFNELKKAFGESVIPYINGELELAKRELELGYLKESRNTIWRVIKQCKSNGGYGRLFDDDRRVPYINAYALLGDVFVKRGDIHQGAECYEKAISELEGIAQADKDILILKGLCYYKLGCGLDVFWYSSTKKLKECFEKSIESFSRAQKTEKSEYVSKCIAKSHIRLGKIYEKSGECELGEKSYNEALHIFQYYLDREERDDCYIGICQSLCGLGEMYCHTLDAKKAELYYTWAKRTVDGLPNCVMTDEMQKERCRSLIEISTYCKKMKRSVECEINSLDAIETAKELYKKTKDTELCELITSAYFLLGSINEEYARRALSEYEILLELMPNIYKEKFKMKRYLLWQEGMLKERDFKKIKLRVERELTNGNTVLRDEKGNSYTVRIDILNQQKPHGIAEIEMCKILLPQVAVDEYDPKCSLRLERVGKVLSLPKELPEEFVTVIYENKKRELLQRVYG